MLIDSDVPENLYADPDGVPQSASAGATVPTDAVSTGANGWIAHADESAPTDHASTAATISIASDSPANLYAVPDGR